jgi:hypothetical protein
LLELLGVFDCAGRVASGGAVAVGCCGSALGFAAAPAGVGVIAGAEFEEEFDATAFAELGAPDAADVAATVPGAVGEGWDAAAFAGAEIEPEGGAVGADGVADPAGTFVEFVGADALEGTSGAGGAGVAAGTCVVDFRARFRKGSP